MRFKKKAQGGSETVRDTIWSVIFIPQYLSMETTAHILTARLKNDEENKSIIHSLIPIYSTLQLQKLRRVDDHYYINKFH